MRMIVNAGVSGLESFDPAEHVKVWNKLVET